ncbi:MAG: DUF3135 domain-containing protein [Pseudomonadota bacterium]
MDDMEQNAFDHEYWSRLWKEDPQAFETERRRLIASFIANAPEEKRQRLEGLQWRVEMERKRAKSPYAATVSLQKMMWESVLGKNGLLAALQVVKGSGARETQTQHEASIVRLQRRLDECDRD